MAFWTKLGTILMTIMFLSSCSWFGGTFGKDDADCPAGACDDPNTTEQTGTEAWYCYGVEKDRSWDCGRNEQPEKITSIDPSAARKAPPPILPPAANEVADIKESESAAEATSTVPATPITLPITQPVESVSVVSPSGSEQGGKYILEQPADSYTVQLIAMQEEGSVLTYASHNGIDAPLYARIESKDADWFVLLLGTYTNRQSAEEAKDSWESTRTLKIRPWVRNLGPLQDAIRLAQN
jgi:septal ring-binding cell division protein DamX